MAKIVQDINGKYWVGKELYSHTQYISFDKVKLDVDNEKITLEPTLDEIKQDIKTMLHISIEESSPVFDKVIDMLTMVKVNGKTPTYFSNYMAKYGVSKIKK